MNIDLEEFDWASAAAVAGVVVTAFTAIVGGLSSRSRERRLERLIMLAKDVAPASDQRIVLDRMILDLAQRMDFRQRGPSQQLGTALFWASQVFGWLLVLFTYVGLLFMLQPLINPALSFWWWLWIAVPAAAVLAALLLVCGDLVRAGTNKQRATWISKNAPLPTPGTGAPKRRRRR